MKVQDLRIGNLVYLYNPIHWGDFINEVVEVKVISGVMTAKEKEIWKDSFGCLTLVSGKNEFNQFSEYVKPIPITEEWLLKCGFEKKLWKVKNSVYFELEKIEILLNDSYYKKGVTYFKSCLLFEFHPKYVHQLQNLYYALTNNELILKP